MRLFQRENGFWYIAFSRTKRKSLNTKDEKDAREIFKKYDSNKEERLFMDIKRRIMGLPKDIEDGDGCIYFIQGISGGLIKIGYAKDIYRRLKNLQASCPLPLKILAVIRGSLDSESNLHSRFAKNRKHGEWFEPTEQLSIFINSLDDFLVREFMEIKLNNS
jgi:hypothetical protein